MTTTSAITLNITSEYQNYTTSQNIYSEYEMCGSNSSLDPRCINRKNIMHVEYQEPGHQLWTVGLLSIPLLTVFGNILVCLSVYKEPSLRTTTNYFIVSLALSDIMVSVLVMPLAVYVEANNGTWLLGDALCDAWVACDVMCCTASILNLTAISIDRFIAVTRPISYAKRKNSKRVYIMIALAWLISLAISSPIALGMNYTERRATTPDICTFYNSDFLIVSSMGSFYIPCVAMIILYWRIFVIIRRRGTLGGTKPFIAAAAGSAGDIARRLGEGMSGIGRPRIAVKKPEISDGNDGVQRGMETSESQLTITPQTAVTNLPTIQEEISSMNIGSKYFLSAPYFTAGGRLPTHRRSFVPELLITSSSCSTAEHDIDEDDDDDDDDDDTDEPSDSLNPAKGIFEMLPTPMACLMTAPQCPVSSLVLLVSPAGTNGGTLSRRHSSVGETGSMGTSLQGGTTQQEVTYKNYASINAGCTASERSDGEDLSDGVNETPKVLSEAENSDTTIKNPNKTSAGDVDGNGNNSASNGTSPVKLLGAAWKNGSIPKISISSKMNLGRFRRLRNANRREKKATKTLAIVLGAFLLCWTPFFTINIINAVCIRYSLNSDPESTCNIDGRVFSACVWLGYINSFLNPAIYTIFNIEFRRAFNKLLRHPCR